MKKSHWLAAPFLVYGEENQVRNNGENMNENIFCIEIDSKTLINNQSIKFKGREYAVSEINAITFSDFKFKQNFITINHTRSLEITFGSEKINIWSAHSILNKSKFDKILSAYKAVSSFTFQQRLNLYINQIKTKGYFEYDDVIIHENGLLEEIKKPYHKVSLCGAFSQERVSNGLDFGVSWIGFSASNPNVICVCSEKPKVFSSPKQSVAFTIKENRDVIMYILQKFDKLNT